uniref:Uncharacterized protein n=1 Tax=Myoviridae sp. ctDzM5 TaxID=2825058 RepID=A0A8S5V8H0_9CAUD|nr:MAG TPA: hypothetical protein [Myoviridae sp. ctDzM5]
MAAYDYLRGSHPPEARFDSARRQHLHLTRLSVSREVRFLCPFNSTGKSPIV